MRARRTFLIIGLTLLLGMVSMPAFAQEATITGTITDETKAVLPGATITANNVATGGQTVAVSDARGEFRLLNLPPGTYKVQAELSGFSTIVVPSIELLVGQNATLPFVMKVAQLSETVTVSSEAPLVDVTSSQVAGNVNPRQMEELPLQGRNWLELSKLVKGITANEISINPGVADDMFQLNLDGQQVTQKISGGFGQPKFSRESIGEFQLVTNLFDITQGRSAGVQVQAVSRAGTNRTQGSFYGFFRDDTLNAADFLTHTVLPYQNQQIGGSLGGPIVKDKVHYFASYEYEREPGTTFSAPAALRPGVCRSPTVSSSTPGSPRVDRSGTGRIPSFSDPAAIRPTHRCRPSRRRTFSAPGRACSATRESRRFASATTTSNGRTRDCRRWATRSSTAFPA